ncbi:MAG TPA: DUF2784 domain-containing protein [Steroidobacteraceae bacterium]|nr:DUF2784 domain-containing protein [Steroidobacteraceae bacterium]
MIYRVGAEVVLVLHFAFIAFVVSGAALAARWPWMAAAHLPAAAWGCFVELTGMICPLTYAENYLWRRAGDSGYAQGFIEHYLLPVIYPEGLTRRIQLALAAAVVLINALIYGWLLRRAWERARD